MPTDATSAAASLAAAPAHRRPLIAIFDSGIGGLTVAAAVAARLPYADLRYLGDTARLPYGTKSAGTVTRYALSAAAALLGDGGTDALVVACNTASSCALPALRAAHGVPVLGVIEPGARRAVAASKGGGVGIIGTERTVDSGAYDEAIAALAPALPVFAKATPLLVGMAEEGFCDGPLLEAALEAYLGAWLRQAGVTAIDTLVLGCTHYPVFKPALTRWLAARLGRELALIDSAEAIADDLAARFPEPAGSGRGQVELLATDGLERFRRVGGRFFALEGASLRLVDL